MRGMARGTITERVRVDPVKQTDSWKGMRRCFCCTSFVLTSVTSRVIRSISTLMSDTYIGRDISVYAYLDLASCIFIDIIYFKIFCNETEYMYKNKEINKDLTELNGTAVYSCGQTRKSSETRCLYHSSNIR